MLICVYLLTHKASSFFCYLTDILNRRTVLTSTYIHMRFLAEFNGA